MKNIVIIFSLLLVAGCTDTLNKLKNVGKPPTLNNINTYEREMLLDVNSDHSTTEKRNLMAQPTANHNMTSPPITDYETLFYEQNKQLMKKTSNSLWQPGSKNFFRDKRTRSVGDIVKVTISLSDQASLNNKTETKRNGPAVTAAPLALGYGKYVDKFLPKGSKIESLLGASSTDSHSGEGKINRTESLQTSIAATVIRVLPSGNLIIKGSQEVRVNHEVRELTLEGIVRPADIDNKNMIDINQIAEARISYGGRGLISSQQQPKYGKGIIDAISPF